MPTCELKFTNKDAGPETVTLEVSPESVALIMAWYGAYYAGDRYTVHFADKLLKKDLNGELVGGLS